MVLLFTVIALISLTAPDSTDSAEKSNDYRENLEEGIDAFYKADWPEARSYFDYLKKQYPDDPRAYFFESMLPFWSYFFVHRNQSNASDFMNASETAIEISRQSLKENPSDTTSVMLLSGLYGYRSLVSAGEGEYKDAIQNAIQGFSFTRKLLALEQMKAEARIGRGLFLYMVGNVPRELKWMTNMFSLSGDKSTGLRELELVAESKSYARFDAKMILAYLYRGEKKFENTLEQLDELIKEFPSNSIFHFFKAETLEEMDRKELAANSYKVVIEIDHEYFKPLVEESKNKLINFSMLGYLN